MNYSQTNNPLLFISHKYLNRNIADVLTDWIQRSTGGHVRVYQSSDPSAEGPRIGQPLAEELRSAIDEAEVVILIYTQAEYNWEYCMWECGMAARSPGDTTRTVVLQCGDDAPRAFVDKLRVRADDADQIKKFAIAFLTGDGFFAGRGPITDLGPESKAVNQWAQELYERLNAVIPHDGRPRRWSIWPSMSLEMDRTLVDEIEAASSSDRSRLAVDWLSNNATVVDATPGAANLFGKAQIRDGTPFSRLVELWQTEYPNRDPVWLSVMAEQLVIGALEERSHPIDWTPIRETNGVGRFLPGAGSLRVVPGDKVCISYHFYASPGAQPVTTRMARIERIHRIDLRRDDPQTLMLVDVLADLERKGWSRLPITGEMGEPRYMVHTGTIDRFMRCSAIAGRDLRALSLADLLTDDEMADLFTSSYVVIPGDADLTDAAAAIDAVRGCQDAFVTASGDRNEPVLGWLTNRDIEEAMQPLLSA